MSQPKPSQGGWESSQPHVLNVVAHVIEIQDEIDDVGAGRKRQLFKKEKSRKERRKAKEDCKKPDE